MIEKHKLKIYSKPDTVLGTAQKAELSKVLIIFLWTNPHIAALKSRLM